MKVLLTSFHLNGDTYDIIRLHSKMLKRSFKLHININKQYHLKATLVSVPHSYRNSSTDSEIRTTWYELQA